MKSKFIKSHIDGSPHSSDEEYEYAYPKDHNKTKKSDYELSSKVKISEYNLEKHMPQNKRAQY